MRALRVGAGEAILLPVIRGLVSEATRVQEVLDGGEFDAVGLSISPEELRVIQEHPQLSALPVSVEEAIYMRELERFGPVHKPPPCFVEASIQATERGLPCVALDMEEEQFSDLFLREVGGLALMRHSVQVRRLARRTFRASTPEEFVRDYDKLANRVGAYRRVERAREAFLATAIADLCRTAQRPLALVEHERWAGVVHRLESSIRPSGA